MISARWERVKELFENALDCLPEERESLLRQLAQEDPGVADQVAELLSSFEQAGDFLVQPCCLAPDFLEDLEIEQQRFASGDILCARFRIVQLIGRGGMGEVYKAWDEELEDHVALKVLRLEISTHELFTSRFRREIQLARRVTHPNVCRIFDSFKHTVGDGTHISVLSMELLQGETLADYLKSKSRLAVAEALPLAQQIIAGLSAIHAAGIIHRDLKPSNLILVPDSSNADSGNYRVKITDFGIAGRLPDTLSQSPQTQVSKLMGTPDYMAPEQLEHGRASIQSDIYSLGLVLYEMVTGSKPFADSSAWNRISADPPPPKKLAADLQGNWNKTIVCCLERNPQYRFKHAQAARESLEGEIAASSIPRKPLPTRLKSAARKRVGVVTIIFLLIVALSIAAFRYFNQEAKPPKAEVASGTMGEIITADPITLAREAARQHYAEAEKRYRNGEADAALVFLDEAIKADPGFVKALMRRADILISLRRYNEGYADWQKAFDLVTNLKVTNPETLRIQGQYYEDTGQADMAENTFAAYKTLYPNDYYAWFYWGSSLDAKDAIDKAIPAFQQASRLQPAFPAPHEHLAELYLLSGRFDDAKQETEEVLNLGAWEWAVWLNSESEFLQGRYESGLQMIRFLQLAPSEEWQSKSFRYTVNFLAEMGRVREAISVLERGIAFDHMHDRPSDEAQKLIALAYLFWQRGNYPAARRRALDAVAADNSPIHICDAGTVLARSGSLKEAHALSEQLPSKSPITRIVFAKERLDGEIKLAAGDGAGGITYLIDASKKARRREPQEYLAHAYMVAPQHNYEGDVHETLLKKRARIWLDAESPFPGLWSTSVITYLNLPVSAENPNKCSLLTEVISLRARAEPYARVATDVLNTNLRLQCDNQTN